MIAQTLIFIFGKYITSCLNLMSLPSRLLREGKCNSHSDSIVLLAQKLRLLIYWGSILRIPKFSVAKNSNTYYFAVE